MKTETIIKNNQFTLITTDEQWLKHINEALLAALRWSCNSVNRYEGDADNQYHIIQLLEEINK